MEITESAPKSILFYPDTEMNVWIRKYALENDLSLSQVLRRAVRKFRDEMEGKHDES